MKNLENKDFEIIAFLRRICLLRTELGFCKRSTGGGFDVNGFRVIDRVLRKRNLSGIENVWL